MNIDLTAQQKTTLENLLQTFLSNTKVWAFGSRVKFTSRPDSDLDLAAFIQPEQKTNLYALKEALDESDLPFRVEVHDWDNLPKSFKMNIEKEYVVVQEDVLENKSISNRWTNVIATDFCIKVADGTHDSPKRNDIGKALITSKHIKGRNIDFENAYLISEENFNQINERSKVDQWDILISMIGEYCGFAYIERNEKVDYAVKNVGIFKTGSKIKAEWLYYYLTSPNGKKTLTTLRSGTSQPYISLGALRALKIPVPTKESEMKQITDILSSLDEKIELNLQMNQTLEIMVQAIFKEWFVDFNFPGFDGELVNGLPIGWRMGAFLELGSIATGKGLKKEDIVQNGVYPVIGANGEIGRTDKYLFDDDLILTGRVGTIGTIQISKGKKWISDNVLISKPFDFFYYTLYVLKSIDLKSLNRGSTQPLITQTDLKNQSVVIPSEKVVIQFENIVSSLYNKVFENLTQKIILTELRDSLLPKLLTGKIPIKEA